MTWYSLCPNCRVLTRTNPHMFRVIRQSGSGRISCRSLTMIAPSRHLTGRVVYNCNGQCHFSQKAFRASPFHFLNPDEGRFLC